jgi:hypothetical protein
MNLYYLIIDKKKLLEFEAIEEILRERDTYYKRINKNFNFWISPISLITDSELIKNIKNTNYFNSKISKINVNDSLLIISNSEMFTIWLSTRIGEFENLSSKLVKTNNSIGIYNKITFNKLSNSYFL